ncbi:homoserine kinase [Ligilactobacillus salivarius]|uniref:Homoserine kinase n=1 Tax=Ligilactobacillus salivarius TaxID=1624 RepID=A0A089QDN6_9LACO|nr:homoserine kinase [Ligilactobacillus salivarius]AIR11214.1 Homoserine kinase [Ligilactobacillus salivarius]
MSVKIIVPATSANIGPGFDSLGLAVTSYLTVTVVEENVDAWYVDHNLGEKIPHDEENLIVKTALELVPDLQPLTVKVESDIPLTRGLGSSSSAIVAGLMLANYFGNLNLSKQELVQRATEIEGHPDNVAPAILGDFVVATYLDGEIMYEKISFPDVSLLAYIPDYWLATKKSRGVLPVNLDFKDAVRANAIGNALVAKIVSGNKKDMGKLMEADLLHETYRDKLVPHFLKLRHLGHEAGAFATYLSGAGPTTMTLIEKDKVDEFIKVAQELGLNDEYRLLEVDRNGARIEVE